MNLTLLHDTIALKTSQFQDEMVRRQENEELLIDGLRRQVSAVRRPCTSIFDAGRSGPDPWSRS